MGLRGVDSNLATAVRTVVILLLAWGIVAWQGTAPLLWRMPGRTLAFLISSGLATGFSWLFYFRALQIGRVAVVTALDKTSLAMTLLLAFLFLGEAITWKIAAGAALILSGMLLIIL